jgi:ribosome-associated translation inhibitor RaiA
MSAGLVFYEKSHRYKLDGAWVQGVTTLIKGGLPNDSLKYWAARTVAEWVADHADLAERMEAAGGRNPFVAFLKEIPFQKRDDAAVRGTDVHDRAERLVHGEEVDVPDHLAGYVQACVAFLDEWQPTPIATERPVAHREHRWAGKFDALLRLPDGRVALVDFKTATGIYPETAFQLAAYSHAEFYVDDDGTEHPMPHTDFRAAVWLRSDGTYDVIPVKADDEVYREFRHLAFVAGAAKRAKGNKTTPGYVGEPLPAPTKTGEAA